MLLTKLKALAKTAYSIAKLIVRELTSGAGSQAIVLGFLTLFSYLTSEAARLATGHYFHWFGVALVAFFGSSLLKIALPEVAKGWATGRLSAEREAAAHQAAHDLMHALDSYMKQAAQADSDTSSHRGPYL